MAKNQRKNAVKKFQCKECFVGRGIACGPNLVTKWVEGQLQNYYVVTRNMIRAYALKWAWVNPENTRQSI